MKNSILGYTFVGLWAKPISIIPQFDNRFAKDLFGDPYQTTLGITPDGLTIAKAEPAGVPTSAVVIGNSKFQVSHASLDKLCEVVMSIFGKLKPAIPDFEIKFAQYGLNFEYTVSELDKTSIEWMGEKYLKFEGSQELGYKIVANELRFGISRDDGTTFAIVVQPRFNDLNAIFVQINDHRSALLEVTSGEDLRANFMESRSQIENEIFKMLSL